MKTATTMVDRDLLPEVDEMHGLFQNAPADVRPRFTAYMAGYMARMRDEQFYAPERTAARPGA